MKTFKNLMKNRVVLGLICIILSLVVCFGITPMFNDALSSTVQIVRVTSEISEGDLITKDMVTTVEVGGYNLPSDVIHDVDNVIGKYANSDFYKGDYILSSKLSDTALLRNEYLSKLDGSNRAISLSITFFAGGLSGKLEQGDIVSLIASDVGEMRETVTPLELQYVEIIATTSSDGLDYNAENVDGELASTITVLATPEQARLIAELEQTGKIHCALVYRGSAENAQLFLDEQDRVLEELYPTVEESEENTDEESTENTQDETQQETTETTTTEAAA
ncbi:MAG: RcpC/CpaB family pilus assembly protein [Lachnospiraceae bacterium]